jgi:hypothetical protein
MEVNMAFKKESGAFTIQAPNFQTLEVMIEGTAPLMIHRFSMKMRHQIEAKQTAKDQVSRKRAPKDYKAEFNGARYISRQGWDGFYAGSIRNAMIGAARFVDGLQMTKAKGFIFVEADGFDKLDGTPLVRIIGKKPAHDTRPVRLESGVADLRNRPRFDQWSAKLRIKFDADHISANDVVNLLARAGSQVGICEGRPGAPNSNGIGFGTFDVKSKGKSAKRGKAIKGPANATRVSRSNGHDEQPQVNA